MKSVPEVRVRCLGAQDPVAPAKAEYVLYWMTSQRRTQYNFALQHALLLAKQHKLPLLIFEALRLDYPWACERFHRFVLDGMADNAAVCQKAEIAYYPYIERDQNSGKGLLQNLAQRAACVVTDEFPCFFLPRMQATAAEQIDCPFWVVDGNGLMPLRATQAAFPTAYAFRRFLQRELPKHLTDAPLRDPLAAHARSANSSVDRPQQIASIPKATLKRWPAVSAAEFEKPGSLLSQLDFNNSVSATEERGGSRSAKLRLNRFLQQQLTSYGEARNQPEQSAASELSPYLHFGHISVHQVTAELFKSQAWSPDKLSKSVAGKRSGWWGMSSSAEAFLDQVVTWRELGYVFAHHRPLDYDSYTSLPPWARASLDEHATDKRQHTYSLEQLEKARTHDELWNAAQLQLVREGRIHNYLRMLWGKKILKWSATPQDALAVMIELNNKYALDGRNPNSYSGIFWVLGRFDRAWGPERPVFGKLRYMTSGNTAKKVKVKQYIAKYLRPTLFE